MLHPFISCPRSRRPSRRRPHPAVFSIALHVVLLGLVIAPERPARYASVPRGVVERVQYMTLAVPVAEPGRARAPRRAPRALRTPRLHRAPDMPTLPRAGSFDLTFALSLVSAQPLPDVPMPDLVDTLRGDGLAESPFASSSRGFAGAMGDGVGGVDSITYVAADVDRSASLAGVNPKPGYPADLLRRSIEASFSVYFVVDTTGRVDTTTVQIPVSVHPHFAQAVREVLVRWRFVPAEVHGRRVRQMMEQTFKFKIVNGQYALAGDDQPGATSWTL